MNRLQLKFQSNKRVRNYDKGQGIVGEIEGHVRTTEHTRRLNLYRNEWEAEDNGRLFALYLGNHLNQANSNHLKIIIPIVSFIISDESNQIICFPN